MSDVPAEESARAVVRDGVLMIRISLSALDSALRGAYTTGGTSAPYKVTDPEAFGKEVALALDAEDETGTTAIHRMLDAAFEAAIDNGAEGVEPDPEADEDHGDDD